jgi:formate transporter
MQRIFEFDAYAPREVYARICEAGVAKARLPFTQLVMLGILAGGFIGLGALFNVVVLSDVSVAIGPRRVLGGVVFSLGLLLVLVAGAELFTGNNLLAMAWAERKVTTTEVLQNWAVVFVANFVGAIGLAWLVLLSGHADNDGGAVRAAYLRIAADKMALAPMAAFASGVLCNVLVCTAVWVALAGRSVTDKFVAIVLPVSAFVAAGFEHSVANMYLLPLALMLQAQAGQPADLPGLARNLVPVVAGNLVGGSVLVALVYHVVYRRLRGPAVPAAAEIARARRRDP